MPTRRLFINSLLIALMSWGALIALTYLVPPSAPTSVIVVFLAGIAVAASVFPLWLRLGQRLRGTPDVGIALRRSVLSGLYVGVLLFLRVLGLLDWTLALVLLLVGFLLEAFLWQREQWQGAKATPAATTPKAAATPASVERRAPGAAQGKGRKTKDDK